MDSTSFQDYAVFRRQQLADTVRELRQQHHCTQEQLATILNCSRSRIIRIENGEGSYELEELEILAALFGIDPNQLTHLAPALQTMLYRGLTTEHTGAAILRHITFPLSDLNKAAGDPSPVFTPDNSYFVVHIITPSEDGLLAAWDLEGNALWRFEHPTYIGEIAFSPDGQMIAFATENDCVVVLDATSRRIIAILDPVEARVVDEEWWQFVNDGEPGYGVISSLIYSRDGKYLAYFNGSNGTIRIWNVADWTYFTTLYIAYLREQFERHLRKNSEPVACKYAFADVRGMQFTTDSTAIVIWSPEKRIEYIDLETPTLEITYLDAPAHCYQEISSVDAHGEPAILHFAAGDEQTITLWETAHGSSLLYREKRDEGAIHTLTVLDHETILATLQSEQSPLGPLVLKNLANGRALVFPEPDPYHTARLATNGKVLVYVTSQVFGKHPPDLHICHLDLSPLRNGRSFADHVHLIESDAKLVRASLPLTGPSLSANHPPARSFIAWRSRSASKESYSTRFHLVHNLPTAATLAGKLDHLDRNGLQGNAQHDGVFVAFYDESPGLLLPVLAHDFERTGTTTLLVDLLAANPTPDGLALREFIQALAGHTLLNGETTPEVVSEFKMQHGRHILILDYAEHLATDTLVYLVTEARRGLAKLVFLVIHDRSLFEQRLAEYDVPGWIEGRMEFIMLFDFSDSHPTSSE